MRYQLTSTLSLPSKLSPPSALSPHPHKCTITSIVPNPLTSALHYPLTLMWTYSVSGSKHLKDFFLNSLKKKIFQNFFKKWPFFDEFCNLHSSAILICKSCWCAGNTFVELWPRDGKGMPKMEKWGNKCPFFPEFQELSLLFVLKVRDTATKRFNEFLYF